MITFRWMLASVLALLSLLVLLPTWFYIARWWLKAIPMGGSYVPLVGGIAGAFALAIVPIDGAWRFFWIPLVLDPIVSELFARKFNGRYKSSEDT